MGNVLVAVTAVLFIVFSPQVMQAASSAAEVFVSGVLPALFPMMILNGLSGVHTTAPGRAAAVTVLFAFGAGSPASAQRLKLLDAGQGVSQRALYSLAGATGVMSPMFIVGTLAAQTGLGHASWVMLLAHWISALAVGGGIWVWMGRKARREQPAPTADGQGQAAPEAAAVTGLAALPAAVSAAAQALLSVCGAMMFFSIIAVVLRTLLGLLFPAWVAQNAQPLAVLWALMEIGGGSFAVLEAFPTPPLALLCGLCSFGGLSIWLQNLLFIGKIIRPGRLLLMRALHGALAYGLCWLCMRCMPGWRAVSAVGRAAPDGSLTLLVIALLICLLAFACPRRASP